MGDTDTTRSSVDSGRTINLINPNNDFGNNESNQISNTENNSSIQFNNVNNETNTNEENNSSIQFNNVNNETNTNGENSTVNFTNTNTDTGSVVSFSPSPAIPSPPIVSPQLPPTDQPINGDQARKLAQALIHRYFTTQLNVLTKHHLDSYDQFIERDLRNIIASKNPLIILKNHKADRGSATYKYKIEIDFGGRDASELFIGTPSLQLNKGQDIRILFPNEARLRNLTYAVPIEMNVYVKVTIALPGQEPHVETIKIEKMNLCNFPLMLQSQYCILNGKSASVLSEMGECPQDQGGYFIVDGSEKVLVTRQEGSFNTLWITHQPADEANEYYCNISSLNPLSREIRNVKFYWTREKTIMTRGFNQKPIYKPSVLEVELYPYIMKPIPIFVLFRAMGIESDKEILQQIFPDFNSPEAKYLADMLIPSINAAYPFLDSWSAIQYIKSLTKGFSVYHVMDILHNQLFPHVEDRTGARVAFLADCVRKILRTVRGLEQPLSRDDTQNQRLLTSGFLCQMLFQNIYKTYQQKVKRTIDEMFNYNETTYTDMDFLKIFAESNRRNVFQYGFMTEGILRGFKGKWMTGVNKEEQGVLQELSRLSYLDFISHLRHAVLDFDTSMKLTGPRHLRGSQYGYFCTSEVPSGASIGITKNLTIMTSISNDMIPTEFTNWLFKRGGVIQCSQMTPQLAAVMVPVYLNSGIVGYTGEPQKLSRVLRLLKRTGCLPPLSSNGFNIPERRIFIFVDEGRPLRPLVCFPTRGTFPDIEKFKGGWRDLVVGSLPQTSNIPIKSRLWIDPLAEKVSVSLEEYIELLSPHQGVIEYLDPTEQNEALIANVPEHILPESTHMEVHPSTILGLLGNCIPYPNHNQSPRNQLSASQSKQAVSVYATNFNNRFDNTANVLCYGQAPLSRTIYQDYFGEGKMTYGQNIILAMGCYGGYNQEDGIIMNADALARGQFRSLNYRSYEAREEDDKMAKVQMRIGNPKNIPQWLDLKPNLDYTLLDENGYVKIGSYVTQNTVIVGRYMITESGKISDASITPQVWTRGRVENVVVTVNNLGLRLVKVRVVQDRVPELGDKFCLTPDHEVLTKEKGWISIADVTIQDSIAQLNREKQTIEYVKPKETYVFEHTGEMYEVKTQGVDLCTTLNHRMYVQTRYSDKYELVEAKDMMGKRVRFNSYSPSGKSDYVLTIGSTTYEGETMNAFLSLLGIWIAEGWVYISEKDCIARLEISAQKPVVQTCLAQISETLSLRSNFVKSTGKYCINSKELAAYFKPLSVDGIHKRLPSWCFELSQKQSQHLLEALCAGDGHETLTSLHYSTSSIGLRDDIQILVQHAGYTSTFVKRMEKGTVVVMKNGTQMKANADNWGIYIRRKRVFPTLNHGHANTQEGQSETIIPYEGKVYCISVPSEVFLVRRNGTIVWTGNSNRHGQKGTLNVIYRGHDMPRTADGITPDMIMNPSALPSRMTIGQILEMMAGTVAAELGAIANTTAFMNDGSPHEVFGEILQKLGMNKLCNQVLYNGMTGEQMTADIYMGVVYGMRLKHMTEDKWNARGQGRKEMRTHQPTGGRGNEGGLKIGEMDRDAILGHGIASFLKESITTRSDGAEFTVCNGCGTIPIYNERENVFLCPLCDGPLEFVGSTVNTLEPIPPPRRTAATFSKVQIPYASKLFIQEMETFSNMSMRILTTRDTMKLRGIERVEEITAAEAAAIVSQPLPKVLLQEYAAPDVERQEQPALTQEDIEKAARELQKVQEETVLQQITVQPVVPAEVGTATTTTNVVTPQLPFVNNQAQANTIVSTIAPNIAPNIAPSIPTLTQFPTDIPLAPGSILPAVPATPQVVPSVAPVAAPPQPQVIIQQPLEQTGGMIQTTSQGIPVINVDTSSAALEADGYRVPGDATASLQPVYPQFEEEEAPRRRSRSRSPKRSQYGGQSFHPPDQPPLPQEETSTPISSHAPVTVVKLG